MNNLISQDIIDQLYQIFVTYQPVIIGIIIPGYVGLTAIAVDLRGEGNRFIKLFFAVLFASLVSVFFWWFKIYGATICNIISFCLCLGWYFIGGAESGKSIARFSNLILDRTNEIDISICLVGYRIFEGKSNFTLNNQIPEIQELIKTGIRGVLFGLREMIRDSEKQKSTFSIFIPIEDGTFYAFSWIGFPKNMIVDGQTFKFELNNFIGDLNWKNSNGIAGYVVNNNKEEFISSNLKNDNSEIANHWVPILSDDSKCGSFISRLIYNNVGVPPQRKDIKAVICLTSKEVLNPKKAERIAKIISIFQHRIETYLYFDDIIKIQMKRYPTKFPMPPTLQNSLPFIDQPIAMNSSKVNIDIINKQSNPVP